MQEIFSLDSVVAVTDPVYPVYVDTNVMAGRTGPADSEGRYQRLVYLPTTAANGFDPPLPEDRVDLVYLCAPTIPRRGHVARFAGALGGLGQAARGHHPLRRGLRGVRARSELAPQHFRNSRSARGGPGVPQLLQDRRIHCTRCAFTVIPKELKARDDSGAWVALHGLWNRRHTTKFNGVSYPSSGPPPRSSARGAAGAQANIDYTMENARLIREGLGQAGYRVFGG